MIEFLYPMFFAPFCSDAKVAALLSEPEGINDLVEVVDCSITLPRNEIVAKRLVINASNVTFDCNYGSIHPRKDLIREDNRQETIKVASKIVSPKTIPDINWEQTKNVTVKNCSEVYGSVRVDSTYYVPSRTHEFISYKNDTGPGYVKQIRETSPTHINFENIHIRNVHVTDRTSLYIEQGASYVTFHNSSIVHESDGLSVYLAPESGFHTIENSKFHHTSTNSWWIFNTGRELMAIDGSEGNVIRNNWFSGLHNGGIFLYRNCGENHQIRYTAPQRNLIEGNTFYYHHASSPEPAVVIGERDGDSPGLGSYCDNDKGWSWDIHDVPSEFNWDDDWESSSTVDLDIARYNSIKNNSWCNRDVNVKTKRSSFNHSNEITGNRRIACD